MYKGTSWNHAQVARSSVTAYIFSISSGKYLTAVLVKRGLAVAACCLHMVQKVYLKSWQQSKHTDCRWSYYYDHYDQEQINIREQLPKYLNSQAKLLTTRCIIIETEKVAKKTHGALTILKQFGIHECGHKEPISGSNCILSMIGKKNEKHYILATQDRDLQEKLRQKPGIPLLYLHNKSPTLEKPSKTSYEKAGQTIEGNPHLFITETQNEVLKNMKKALGVEEKVDEPKVVSRKKKTHNPNPLSCKKKKKKPGMSHEKKGVAEGKVRKRKNKKPAKEQLHTVSAVL